MRAWHYTAIVFIIAFVIGALYPAPVNYLKGKVGL